MGNRSKTRHSADNAVHKQIKREHAEKTKKQLQILRKRLKKAKESLEDGSELVLPEQTPIKVRHYFGKGSRPDFESIVDMCTSSVLHPWTHGYLSHHFGFVDMDAFIPREKSDQTCVSIVSVGSVASTPDHDVIADGN
jgi:hypothetical protein